MALLKAFVCQVILLGLYKMFLEQVVEEHLVPNELTRNCLVGFVCLVCFGIQLYTEKIEDQTSHAEPSRTKSRRRSPPDTAETVSDFLDARTVHMMRTLDAAMQHMNQMSTSDGYVHNVMYAASGPEAAVIEQTFVKEPDVALVEEICMTKLSDAINAEEKTPSEPIVIPIKVEKNINEKEKQQEEEEEEEESETKSDVCEEEEEDVVTVIDASKQKLEAEKTNIEATESEEEEEDEEEQEQEDPAVVVTKSKKIEVKPVKQLSKEEEEDDEEESDEEQDEVVEDAGKVAKKS